MWFWLICTLHKKGVAIFNSDNTPVLKGKLNTSDGFWDVKISSSHPVSFPISPTNPNAFPPLHLDKTKSEMASYLHPATGWPTKSIFIQATKNGNFIIWTGRTTNLISRNLPLSLPNIKGHLRQEQQNLRSTKLIPTAAKLEVESPPDQYSKTQNCFFTLSKK